ncbi:DUF3099 domain-containing protein [Corynebacterium choanae]|uniref:DUF3099 domain-containing protein n=1 Tax=Corynebacterium choanae TaxID=1862358 RepID=A0A3G6J788_9CORY|nr:DUF3099 domain-containing protein [Corynebacterium choanae]AZA13739.1 hypothetical protein CCHOA_06735 [Corynebacterium choanae]
MSRPSKKPGSSSPEHASRATVSSVGGRRWPFRRRENVQLITSKQLTYEQSLRKREIRYAWLQGSRIPFFLLSAWAYMGLHNPWLSAIFFTISVPLPWVAVMIGNGQGEPRDARMKNVYKPDLLRQEQRAAMTALTGSSSVAGALPAAPSTPPDMPPGKVDTWEFNEATGKWQSASTMSHDPTNPYAAAPDDKQQG